MRLNHSALAAVLCLALVHISVAQGTVRVIVETNVPDAVVFADSLRIGLASEGQFDVPATTRMVRLAAPGAGSWSVQPISQSLDAEGGDTVFVSLDFPYQYRIESIPYGADVFHEAPGERLKLGATPLLYESERPLEGSFAIEQAGYVTQRLSPGRDVWNRHSVVLDRATGTGEATVEVDWTPPKRSSRWIDYAAIGLAATAGVLSVHYKFKADNLYDEYRRTGDPAIEDRIHRFDRLAALSLGTMQVGVGVFALRLALR